MSTLQQVQSVAKRLEKMLETALNQLKVEQKLRKEGDSKAIELELSLVNAEHTLKSAEENFEHTLKSAEENFEHKLKSAEEKFQNTLAEKEEEIIILTARVEVLERELQQKEQELLDCQDGLLDGEKSSAELLEQSAEKFEDRLKLLLDIGDETNVGKEVSLSDNGVSDNDMEYTKDEEFQGDVIKELEDDLVDDDDIKDIIKCVECSDVFDSKKEFSEHQKETGHGYTLSCSVCERKFKTKYTLKSHENVVHSDRMPFKCKKCDQRFKDAGSWKRHQANDDLHRRIDRERQSPNLMCNICGKKFARNRRWCLDQHYLTHLDTKRFPCNLCGKDFRHESYLGEHMNKCKLKMENN